MAAVSNMTTNGFDCEVVYCLSSRYFSLIFIVPDDDDDDECNFVWHQYNQTLYGILLTDIVLRIFQNLF